MKILMAPLQGFTDAVFRHFHAEIYGKLDGYFTPFVRMEHGTARPHDLRDACDPLNANHSPAAQIIFRNIEEFDCLTSQLISLGHRHIDLNMGCPFVPQVRKGRGAGVIGNPALVEEITRRIASMPDICFSVKMRLGISDPDQWQAILPLLNAIPLSHITIHPRTASQQYGGSIDMARFEAFLENSAHPVIYNGDITTPAQIADFAERYPQAAGIMIGRGLLSRPSLVAEWLTGKEWNEDTQLQAQLKLHDAILAAATQRLCGGSQILAHMLPYWEYFGTTIPRKTLKAIKKSSTLPAYLHILSTLQPHHVKTDHTSKQLVIL